MYLLLSLALLFVLVFVYPIHVSNLSRSFSLIGDSHLLVLNRYLIFANTQLCPSSPLAPSPGSPPHIPWKLGFNIHLHTIYIFGNLCLYVYIYIYVYVYM